MRRRRAGLLAGFTAAVLAAAGLAFLSPTASHAEVDPEAWYVLTSRHSDLVLDIEGASSQDDAALIQWNRTDTTNQQFRFVDAGEGHYRVQSRHSGKVLGLADQNTADGAEVVQESDTGATDQQWSVTENGDYATLVNRLSGKALDVWEWSTSPGDRISQYDPTGGTNQQWQLVEIGGGDPDPEPDPEPGPSDCDNPPSQPGNLSGSLGAHDPALWAGCDGEPWYVFATGDGRFGDGNIPIRRSTDNGRTWRDLGHVWDTKPAWLSQQIPGVDNLWAPEIHYDADQGKYYLYYTASTFGSQRSLIALATNTTLDPSAPGYRWVDEGIVFESREGDAYNAIDPNIIVDDDGTRWMVYGSWWRGIHTIELDWPSGKPASGASPIRLATKDGGIEGPSMMKRGDYYYLFVSLGRCCAEAESTYQIAVGRSTSPTGPFLDSNGVDMRNGGGTVVLAGHGGFVASGGQSLHRGLMAYHSYGSSGGFALGIEQIQWNAAGWPVLDGN
ncbi:family 43 glycosylhydrolase [Glycomyces sp. L485]|uniref:family 43 glycosylhydrolase n=1 Tax=Glycomyces sp. L485 TaxID=2909235 RepID=UPI001F4BB029|nr:family 43 glycosylhydrolase [Glycomyces sp. L485]MCH7229341.1 family 43 glycosylhydrolase [Glycomyces sp. L485]